MWKWAVAAVAVAWVGFIGLVYSKMVGPPGEFAAFMAKMPGPLYLAFPFETLWDRARAGTLDVGAEAPDFELAPVAGGEPVRLSSFRGARPVALIFGSYT